MLTISKALSSGQAQSYHKLEFTSDAQNYYKQGDTVKGEWQGKLAASLGLSGEVSPSSSTASPKGCIHRPRSRWSSTVPRRNIRTRTGQLPRRSNIEPDGMQPFQLPSPFRLPPWSEVMSGCEMRIAPPSQLPWTSWSVTHMRGSAATTPPKQTGKFIAAKFEHDTARPVDGYAAPQLHTHAVIFNVTERD